MRWQRILVARKGHCEEVGERINENGRPREGGALGRAGDVGNAVMKSSLLLCVKDDDDDDDDDGRTGEVRRMGSRKKKRGKGRGAAVSQRDEQKESGASPRRERKVTPTFARTRALDVCPAWHDYRARGGTPRAATTTETLPSPRTEEPQRGCAHSPTHRYGWGERERGIHRQPSFSRFLSVFARFLCGCVTVDRSRCCRHQKPPPPAVVSTPTLLPYYR